MQIREHLQAGSCGATLSRAVGMGGLFSELFLLQVLVGIFLMYLVREPPKNLPQVSPHSKSTNKNSPSRRYSLVMCGGGFLEIGFLCRRVLCDRLHSLRCERMSTCKAAESTRPCRYCWVCRDVGGSTFQRPRGVCSLPLLSGGAEPQSIYDLVQSERVRHCRRQLSDFVLAHLVEFLLFRWHAAKTPNGSRETSGRTYGEVSCCRGAVGHHRSLVRSAAGGVPRTTQQLRQISVARLSDWRYLQLCTSCRSSWLAMALEPPSLLGLLRY